MKIHIYVATTLLFSAASTQAFEIIPNVRSEGTSVGFEIPFQPFRLEELINPETGVHYRLDEEVALRIDGQLYFQGTGAQLLENLNQTEAHLNRQGASLQRGGKSSCPEAHERQSAKFFGPLSRLGNQTRVLWMKRCPSGYQFESRLRQIVAGGKAVEDEIPFYAPYLHSALLFAQVSSNNCQ